MLTLLTIYQTVQKKPVSEYRFELLSNYVKYPKLV